MAISVGYGRSERLTVAWHEVAGAIGDSVTVLPIVVALARLTGLSLAHALLGFAVFQVVWGLYYGVPVSVEPMKALAALVIAGSLSPAGLAMAGLLAGGVLLAVGLTGTLDVVETYVGQPVVRGIQLAVAAALLETGVRLAWTDLGMAAAGAALAVGLALAGHRRAGALGVVALGASVAVHSAGLPSPAVPSPTVTLPPVEALSVGTVEATLAQLAMTVGNAAVATSLLLGEYFDADVSADDLATSMGVMNLLAVPLGAIPMCHGSGGVAGKYAFGARSASANLVLGVLYAAAAVLAVEVVAAFPLAVLGAVLAVVAAELGRTALDSDAVAVTVGVGVVGLLNIGVAFVLGVLAWTLRERVTDTATG